jgi:hypothetical protein
MTVATTFASGNNVRGHTFRRGRGANRGDFTNEQNLGSMNVLCSDCALFLRCNSA